jgi:hypothetical protein
MSNNNTSDNNNTTRDVPVVPPQDRTNLNDQRPVETKPSNPNPTIKKD